MTTYTKRINCSAAGIARAMLLSAVLGWFGAGCSKPAEPPPAPATNQPPAKEAGAGEASTGAAVANVDNGAADVCDLLVDGRKTGELKPFSVTRLALSPGKHEFKFMRGDQEADRIEAELPAGKVTIVNRGALSTYLRVRVAYSTTGPFGGTVPQWETISTQRVVIADFGLLDPLPRTITFMTTFQGQFKNQYRTKLCKQSPKNMSADDAAVILSSNPNVYSAGSQLDRNDANTRALQALKAAGKEAEIRDIMINRIDRLDPDAGGEEWALHGASYGLTAYEAQIPDNRLLEWVAKPCTNLHGLGVIRAQRATEMLVARGQENTVLNMFGTLPEANRMGVLRNCKYKGSNAFRNKVVAMSLQNPTPAIDDAVGEIVEVSTFEPEQDVAAMLDARIESLPAESRDDKDRKRRLQRTWANKLCYGAKNLNGDWAANSLVRLAQDEDRSVSGPAALGLINRDKTALLMPSFPKMKSDLKQQVLTIQQQRCLAAGRATADALALFRAGLEDSEAGIRIAAFQSLIQVYRANADPAQLSLLQATLGKEKDEAAKKKMDDLLKAVASVKPPPPRPGTGQPPARTPGTAPAVTTQADGWPVLKVSGVVAMRGRMWASINNRTISEGDSIEGVQVLSVSKDGVKVSFKGETRTLPVGKSGK